MWLIVLLIILVLLFGRVGSMLVLHTITMAGASA